MKMRFHFLTISISCSQLLAGQGKAVFMEGYALRNYKDTIKCKVLYDFVHPLIWKTVTLEIEGDQISFPAGSVITGFGVYGDSTTHHYGYVSTSELVGKRIVEQDLFIRKIVTGAISLYQNHFHTVTTRRKSFDSPIDKPISTSSKTTYYISKHDPDNPVLSKAEPIAPYRIKDLGKYMKDNESIYENAPKDLTIKDLIGLLERYNQWWLSKKN